MTSIIGEITAKKKFLLPGVLILALILIVVAFARRSNDTEKSSISSKQPAKEFGRYVTPKDKLSDNQTVQQGEERTLASQPFDLSNWKLTLPVTTPDDSEAPLEIRQPELASYQQSPWFMLTSDKKGVVFRAPVNAATTQNSDYPRSELREMTDGGTKEAYWPSKTGTHTLFLDQAITAVPKGKPVVVAGQIHGDDDDLIVIRLEYPKLLVSRGGSNLATLDENYTLGKRFTVKFVASNGEIKVYYNNSVAPVHTLKKEVNEAYFKAGVYTQSNCEIEEKVELCNDNNYGEVVIYDAKVTHEQGGGIFR